MKLDIRVGDCREVMAAMEADSVDAIVTDPPYGLEFMGKEWDRLTAPTGGASFTTDGMGKGFKALPSYTGSPNPSCRTCRGTLRGTDRKGFTRCRCEKPDFPDVRGKQARGQQDWHYAWAVEALRVAKPGAHLVAAGGTRTFHRLVCAIEDAGWEIRDTACWLYGCLSEDTEILSSGGWLSHEVLREGQEVAAFDPETGDLRWSPIETVYRYDHEGQMIQVGPSLVTPNHRVVLKDGSVPLLEGAPVIPRRLDGPFAIVEASELRLPTIDYAGLVWCVRVATGAFVGRRNGKVFVTGNSGFPKSADVSKHIDAQERTRSSASAPITAPATDAARQWSGWGTALKPAVEFFTIARKPLAGTVASNVQEFGTGALNIEGCRIGYEAGGTVASNPKLRKERGCKMGVGPDSGGSSWTVKPEGGEVTVNPAGRWPANVVLSHADGCREVGTRRVKSQNPQYRSEGKGGSREIYGAMKAGRPAGQGIGHADVDGMETVAAWECEPDCPVRLLDEQSGTSPAKPERIGPKGGNSGALGAFAGSTAGAVGVWPADPGGGASRFFYTAKASSGERHAMFDRTPLVVYADPAWANAVLAPRLLSVTGISPARVTAGSTIPDSDGSAWSMCWCGSLSTDPFHPAMASIIETETSSTTESRTFKRSARPHTNGCMAAVFGAMANGGSPASCAGSSSPWESRTGTSAQRDGPSTEGADLAISVGSWLKSASGRPGKGGGHRVSDGNTHPT